MAVNSQEALHALIQAEIRNTVPQRDSAQFRPIVTIAREYGAGGEEIGLRLAEALDINYFDKEIIDRIARAAHSDAATMAALDERVLQKWDIYLSSIVSRPKHHPSEYLHSLIHVILGIAETGGVIMGRGAHIILRGRSVFRVRIVGSEDICTQRLALFEGEDPKSIAQVIRDTNAQRSRFLWETFKIRADDPAHFDVIVNTDYYNDLTRVVDFLTGAYRGHAASRGRRVAALPP